MKSWLLMMRKKSLSQKIKEAQELLGADNKQMARQMRITAGDFEAIKEGAWVLPMPVRKTLERRLTGLLERCGINTEQ